MNRQVVRFVQVLVVLCVLSIVAGCGTTAVIHKPAESKAIFDRYKTLSLESSAAEGVIVPDSVQMKVKELVKAHIEGKYCPNRFESISAGSGPGPNDLILQIKYTTYDEGNRFARFMLAGLGGIKIHSDVVVKDAASGDSLSQAECGKTFRWGGIYGASTGIEEIEKWYAEEVAKTFAKILGIYVEEEEK